MRFSIVLFALLGLLSFIHSEKKKIIYLIRHGETNFNTDPVPRAKQSAECVAQQHSSPVEMIEDPLVIYISWVVYEGKTYQEAFGDEKGGDYMFHPEKLIIPEGETFYSVMDRLRLFFVKFWESDETECTIVSHGAITNILSLMFLQAPLEKFWSMYMSACGVSKVQMKSIYSFTIEYWNANHFLKEGEKKYLGK